MSDPMIHALGFSENTFDAARPGRLCRGRERWIERWETDEGSERTKLTRTVMSGALFTDTTAADARRGVAFSRVDLPALLAALYPEHQAIAFMEDGHPADIPSHAEDLEAYDGYRAGGRQEFGLVRWHAPARDEGAIRALLDDKDPDQRVRGFLVVDAKADRSLLMENAFALVGFSTLDSPPARYQPSALPDVLDHAHAVVVFHRDKHGPAVAVYSKEPHPHLREVAETQARKAHALFVPFAIPPMLARWDRALSELRAVWNEDQQGTFPVPDPAEE